VGRDKITGGHLCNSGSKEIGNPEVRSENHVSCSSFKGVTSTPILCVIQIACPFGPVQGNRVGGRA
jgi:hypothetical protein